MTRTQIQLPDELHSKAKKFCREREISMAELARRGIEYMLSVWNPSEERDWQPPKPKRLGWNELSEGELKRLAQEGTTEATLVAEPDA